MGSTSLETFHFGLYESDKSFLDKFCKCEGPDWYQADFDAGSQETWNVET